MSSTSIFAPQAQPTQRIVVSDCVPDVCAPVQSIVVAGLANIGTQIGVEATATLSLPFDSFAPDTIPSVVVLGKTPVSNTFGQVMLSPSNIMEMRSLYGTLDDHDIAVNEIQTTVSIAATGVTALPAVTLHADFKPASFVTSTKMRQFCVIARIKVPETVYRLTLTASGTASEIPESIVLEFTETECREVIVMAIQTAARDRFIVSYGTPTTSSAITYELPFAPGAASAPLAGATLTAATFDSSFVQIAASVTLTTWNVPWSGALAAALLHNKGISAPGSQSRYSITRSTWPLPGTQPQF